MRMFTISLNYFRDRLSHHGIVDTVLWYYQYNIVVVTVPYLGIHNDGIDRLVKVTDIVSNVLGIKNNAPLPQSGKAGGQMSHSYTYDPLYRLASATGTYKGTDNKSASYTLSMGYDNMHRITSKKQHLSQTGVQFEGTLNAGYDLTYTYQKADGKKFQLDNVRDINYRTEEAPTDSTTINNGHKYEYDANGNLIYINTSRVKKDGKEDEKTTEQKYRWDEENRLLAADENGFVSNYWYDADGERTVKTSGENEAIYVNSEFSGGNTVTARFSLYVSPYLVAGQGGKYTKHIYIGSQRIVSKLGDLASYGADPRRIPYAGNEADGLTINYKDKYAKQLQSIKDNYKAFDQPYNGKDNDDYVNGQGFCCNDGTPEAAQARAMARTRAANDNFHDKDNYEKMQFYYHPDHLGSSSYITNLDGEVSQHIEYVPFGEVFIEERNNTWNTPYLFNSKEFDEETGMYYYGARYYEPRLSLWMSVDPLECKHPEISTYCQANNNPIKYIDPDGLDNFIINEVSGEIIRQKTDGKTHSFYLSDGKSNVLVGAFEYNKKDLIGLSGRISFTNTKGESAAFAVKSGSENKSFISSNALAALIGAVGTVAFSDITINQFSYSDGRSPAPSVSHKNGKNGDLRYLRTDKSGSQTDVGSNNFDEQREQALTNALYKFGWKDMISEKYNNKLLPHTSSAKNRGIRSNHSNHLHLQGFKPNIKTVEYINALPEVVVIGKRK